LSCEIDMIHPALVTPEELQELERSISYDFNGVGLAEVLSDCVIGRAQIWRLTTDAGFGMLVSRIQKTDSGKELLVWHMAGNGLLKELPAIDAKMIDFALSHYCKSIRAFTRPGLGKLMGNIGYAQKANIMVKDLST
jgi:hypothetical protein